MREEGCKLQWWSAHKMEQEPVLAKRRKAWGSRKSAMERRRQVWLDTATGWMALGSCTPGQEPHRLGQERV